MLQTIDRPIKVLLADGQRLFREGLKALFEAHNDFEVVSEAENGKDAINAIVALLNSTTVFR